MHTIISTKRVPPEWYPSSPRRPMSYLPRTYPPYAAPPVSATNSGGAQEREKGRDRDAHDKTVAGKYSRRRGYDKNITLLTVVNSSNVAHRRPNAQNYRQYLSGKNPAALPDLSLIHI